LINLVKYKEGEASWISWIKRRIDNNMNFLAIAEGPTGCLSKDTIISATRGKNCRKYTIEELYNMHKKISFNSKIPTYIRSFNGEEIRLNKVKDIYYSGIKKVYNLTLENGLSIKATSDHKFMTKNGWIELYKLNDEEVMCDTLNAESSNRKRLKLRDITLCVGKNHPYRNKLNNEVKVHTLIYEARLNHLSFLEYLDILLNEPTKCKTLKYVDSDIYMIHHKDGFHYNNSIDNLDLVRKEEHYKLHNLYSNFSQGIPKWSKVKKIKYIGNEKTYDIECVEPHHNFVANGIVVHNSGKSYAMLRVGYMIDQEFNPYEQVAFSFKGVMDIINKFNNPNEELSKRKYKVLIFDEAQTDLSNREWQNRVHKLFNYLLSTFRHQNIIVLFTSPYADFLDSQSMKLLHVKFEIKGWDKSSKTTTIVPKILQYNSSLKKFYYHLLFVNKEGRRTKMRKWMIKSPPIHIIEPYERMKTAFTTKLNQQITDELNSMEEEKTNGKKGTDFNNKLNPDSIQPIIWEVVTTEGFRTQKELIKQLELKINKKIDLGQLNRNIKSMYKKGWNVYQYKIEAKSSSFARD
jgi:hypothetical protein